MKYKDQLIEIKDNVHSNKDIESSIERLIEIVKDVYPEDIQKHSTISSLEDNKVMLLKYHSKATVDVFDQIYTLIVQTIAWGV